MKLNNLSEYLYVIIHMYIKYIFAAEVIVKNTLVLRTVHLQIIISNSGHYQSIQPSENNQIIRHYRWTKNRSQSRLCSVGEPIGCSSRISSKKRCYDEKECGEQSTGKRPCLTSLTTYDTSDALESIIGSSSRKIATGCHICNNLFKKNAVKKKCPCGLYCHKKCLGNCTHLAHF